MAKAQAAKKGATKKRRERKNIEKGAAHIRASFNNTIVTITDLGGKDITEVPSHEEVTKAAENAQPTMLAVIKDLVAEC